MSNRWTETVDEFLDEIDATVFGGGALLTLSLIGLIGIWPDASATALSETNEYLLRNVGWLYLWVVFLAVVFCLWLLFGPWGRLKLGAPDETPEFGLVSYFAMMFSAGLAVGLVFWGPGEALSHYQSGPPLFEAAPQTEALMPGVVQYTLFHSGISPWSAYMVFAVTIGYFVHRKDAAFRPAVIFAPFVGTDNLDGWWAKALDAVVVVISVGGICVSLGFGVIQFLAGVNYNWGVQVGDAGTVLLTLGLTIAFTASAAVGVQRGIRRISDFNIVLFAGLLLAALVFAPLSFVFGLGSEALGGLISDFVTMSLYMNFANEGVGWVGDWTMFFWAWWLAFGPMIGIFIARISRGRTIRQVVFAGLVGTSAASFPWFIALGGSALWVQSTGQAELLGILSNYGVEGVGFALFEQLVPFSDVFSALYLLLVLTFLITTIDSSTLSVAMLTVGGREHPTVLNRVIWGTLVGLLTAFLIVAGGLATLQAFVVLVGLPTALMCMVCLVGMLLELERQVPVLRREREHLDDDIIRTRTQDAESSRVTQPED